MRLCSFSNIRSVNVNMLAPMYEIKDELTLFFEADGNKIFFVYRIKGVSSDVGKLRKYFQSVKNFKFYFSKQEY